MTPPDRGFLPNFCANRTVFLTVLVVELLAFVLALADTHAWEEFWPQLALKSLFMQWVALGIAAVLCRSRRRLAELTTPATTLAAFGIAQLITLLCSLPALWLAASAGLGPDLTEQWPVIVRNQAISGIITLLALRYFYVQHQWQQQIEAEARARLQALQARIHPHFLFNTLNAIAGLIPGRPDQAEQAVLDLADLLRSALADRASVPLAEELELTRRYLAIEKLRMGERLRVDWRLDDDLPLDTPLPPLLLQPLVENAIRHGIQRLPDGGTLGIRVEKRATELRFTITNPQPPDQESSKAGQQIAQDNVRQRLQLAYETMDPLAIVVAPEHYQVSFAIPLARP